MVPGGFCELVVTAAGVRPRTVLEPAAPHGRMPHPRSVAYCVGNIALKPRRRGVEGKRGDDDAVRRGLELEGPRCEVWPPRTAPGVTPRPPREVHSRPGDAGATR